MRFHSYFNTAVKIISLYDGSMPLAHFLKKFFSENKKHGSKDRKLITHACYNYFRPGFALKNLSIEERLKAAIFLCNDYAGEWSILYDVEWIKNWDNQLRKRIYFIRLNYNFSVEDIFPLINETSKIADKEHFILSHLIQPNVFLRIRNHQHESVFNALHHHHILFKKVNDNCVAINNSGTLENIINIDKDAVIQDYSSQRVREFLEVYKAKNANQQSQINVWDCCAGSGGKSILAYDVLENIRLTVSDIRASIIHNLKKRFKKADIKNYDAFIADVASSSFAIQHSTFDLVICDAPCTGSGTWSRTPEQLYFFQPGKAEVYSSLQKKIACAALAQLKQEGYFLYITCSVFKIENEEVIDYLINKFKLTIIKMELLAGYDEKADTMFAALLKKN